MSKAINHIDEAQLVRLVDGIVDKYGFDFRQYSPASLKRRISALLASRGIQSVAALEETIMACPLAFQDFVHGISVNVTSMFRDPSFYRAFRRHVAPLLATYPFIRLWNAGCSTGEEVYSIAITLHEEGLLERTRIYATDMDVIALERARQGIFSMSMMKEYSANYINSGGKTSLSDYYLSDAENALFSGFLSNDIVFSRHNLASESSFNEFHVVLCRNVMIYFDNTLRQRVLSLLHDSLVPFGFLGLGSKESLRFSDIEACYERLEPSERLYKKVI